MEHGELLVRARLGAADNQLLVQLVVVHQVVREPDPVRPHRVASPIVVVAQLLVVEVGHDGIGLLHLGGPGRVPGRLSGGWGLLWVAGRERADQFTCPGSTAVGAIGQAGEGTGSVVPAGAGALAIAGPEQSLGFPRQTHVLAHSRRDQGEPQLAGSGGAA